MFSAVRDEVGVAWMKAMTSSATISLFLYIIIRGFTFDFPMTWLEEIMLFVKVIFTGTTMMVLITTGCAGLYGYYERVKRHKRTA